MRNHEFQQQRPAWHGFAGRLAGLFGIRFYDMYYAHRALSSSTDSPDLPIAAQVRLATAKDLDAIVSRQGTSMRAGFTHCQDIGSTCYVGLEGASIAGYLWVNRQVVEMAGMHLARLPPGHAFSHGAYVFPEYRNRKFYQALRATVCNEMRNAGCHFMACLVDKAQAPSIHVLSREGMNFQHAAVLKLPGFRPIVMCNALK